MERGAMQSAAPSYLGWSIFTTLCCCLPLGIAAIVCSTKVQSANGVGDSSGAMEASKKARMFNIIGLVCGIILIIIVVSVRVSTGM